MAESWGNHIAIVTEGILRQPNDSSPIMSGLMLYRSLVKDHRVSLIIDTSSEAKKKVQYWLLMNGMTDHTKEIYWEDTDPEDDAERRIAQIGRLRQDGPLSFVMESSTECATALFKAGVPTLLYLHPQYMHPEHRPNSSPNVKPWDELLAEQMRQREARATDTRLSQF